MCTVNFLSLTTDFDMSETCELLSWYLRGCNSISIRLIHKTGHMLKILLVD